eukprot:gene4486-7867_t
MLDKIPGIEKLQDDDVIMVTGGTGLYGKAIQTVIEKLKITGKWIFLSSKDGDLRIFEETKALFEKHKPTYVIHLAAFVGGLFRNMNYKVDFWINNVNMNNAILQLSHEYKVKKVVSCLSTCVFPDKIEKYPFDESVLSNGPPHFSNDAYAYSKRMLFHLGNWYMEQDKSLNQKGTLYTSVIPTNLYGPNDNYHLKDGHVLPALMHKCYNSQKDDTDFVVFGSGKPLRQFLYSIDAAELMLWALCNYEDTEPVMFTVSPEEETSIGEVAKLIKDAFKLKQNMVFDTSKADGQFKKTATNAKLMKLFPDFKFTPMDIAIQESVDWFLNNYETARK